MEFRLEVSIEGYPAELPCHILVGNDTTLSWYWEKSSTYAGTYTIVNETSTGSIIKVTSNQTISDLKFTSAATTDTGFYRCTVSNPYGSYARIIELRIKSNLYYSRLSLIRTIGRSEKSYPD